jgi:hypothetical protein
MSLGSVLCDGSDGSKYVGGGGPHPRVYDARRLYQLLHKLDAADAHTGRG